MLGEAAAGCTCAAAARQLANRPLESGFDRDDVRALYGGLTTRSTSTAERPDWAYGITDLFRDCAGAGQELAELEASVQGHILRDMQSRRRRRLEHVA
jgi:hypothetical protein